MQTISVRDFRANLASKINSQLPTLIGYPATVTAILIPCHLNHSRTPRRTGERTRIRQRLALALREAFHN